MQKGISVFHWQRPRQLPLDIKLEVETLVSDLRGEKSLPFQHADEAGSEAFEARGFRRHERGARLSRPLRLCRFVGGHRADEWR
jgi:hypothetical protein